MDQAVLRAIVAPVKLVWKSQLGKDLISTYGVTEKNAAAVHGAVTAVLTVSGELEGRILFILTEQTAKSIEAAFTSRWDEGLSQRTLDSVGDMMKPIIDNIPKLLETGGHKCTAELSGVMDTQGKGVTVGGDSTEIILLATAPDLRNPAAKDEISVWVMLKAGDGSQVSKTSGGVVSEQATTAAEDRLPEDGFEDQGEDPGDGNGEAATSSEINDDDDVSEGDAAILNELRGEFEGGLETDSKFEQDLANMLAAEEALAAEEPALPELSDGNRQANDGPTEQEDSADVSESDDSEPDGSEDNDSVADDSEKVFAAIQAGVITTEKLEIVDSEGKVRTVLATLRDGSPYLSIADGTGRIRATLRLDSEGDARLTFVDEAGVETWMAPRDELLPINEREPVHKRPVATPTNGKPAPADHGSSDRKLRPQPGPQSPRQKIGAPPVHGRPGAHRPAPGGKPPKKSGGPAASRRNSPRTRGPKPTGKPPQRRTGSRKAGVR